MADIFNADTTATPSATENAQQTILSSLVGDDKKYKDNEGLANAYQNADGFIEQMKTENAQLREELDKRLNGEDMLSEIKRERKEQQDQAQAAAQENTTSKLDEQSLSELISKTVTGMDAEKVSTSNIMTVDAKMKEVYGVDKATEVTAIKAKELGLSVDYLGSVAAKSPQAFYNLIGLSQTAKPTTPVVTASTTNTQAVHEVNKGTAIQEGTWESFEALRKSDPRKYFTPSIQNQLFKSRNEKGPDGFYNRTNNY